MTALRSQLRDFTVGAIVAVIVATCAFVAVRNTELAEHQLELAGRAIDDLAAGREPLANVHAAFISSAASFANHPYLRHRRIFDDHGWSDLDPARPDAKLFYDTAQRVEREHHAIAELMADGSGRALMTRIIDNPGAPDGPNRMAFEAMHRGAPSHTGPQQLLAVAITAPARPAPYPLLVLIGVLGLGGALAAAGALVGGAAARVGTFAGVGTLAIPCVLWHAPIATAAIVLIAAALALAQRANLTDRLARGLETNRTALGFLAPAAVAMGVLVAAPFLIGLVLGFYDHHHGTWTFVGLSNFTEILSGGGRPLDDPLNFWFILGVTVLWTVANIVMHVTIGVSLAMVLSRKWLVGKGVWRMLFILPWAVPNYITALIWKGMFQGEYGAINSLLHAVGLSDVSWFSSWATAFSANVITNTWLGFPFMMVVALGALESIPAELYEAASVDGASKWQRFRHITLPHLRPALGPAIALGSIWTFNMFNVIFLVSGGAPGGSTNILVTDAYRWAFERGERYGMAAAYATIIFLILLLWTVFGTRIVRSKTGEE